MIKFNWGSHLSLGNQWDLEDGHGVKLHNIYKQYTVATIPRIKFVMTKYPKWLFLAVW